MHIKNCHNEFNPCLVSEVISMGVRESVGELEAAMSELEGSAAAKAKKTRETAVREDMLGGMEVRIGDIEGGIAELRENVGALQKKISMLETAKEKSGAGGYAAVEKRIREMESRAASARPPAGGKDYSADIAELKKSVSEIRNGITSGAAKGVEPAKAPTKDLLELKSRMDVLQKYVEGRMGSIDRIVEDRLINSGAGEKDAELLKKHETRLSDMERKQGEILRVKEDVMESLKDSLQHSVNGFKSGLDRHIGDAAKKMEETTIKIGKEQESFRKDVNEKLNEFSRRMDSNRNDTAKMISEALKSVPKADDIRKSVDERIGSKIAEFSKKVEDMSRYDLNKLKNVADAERRIDDRLKLFALNSDVEKVWKEAESLRRYIDEKSKYADGLANSLRAWESRRLELAARERDFDEKISAFPELKMLDSRIRKMERAIADLQRHFVAAKIAEPIIME